MELPRGVQSRKKLGMIGGGLVIILLLVFVFMGSGGGEKKPSASLVNNVPIERTTYYDVNGTTTYIVPTPAPGSYVITGVYDYGFTYYATVSYSTYVVTVKNWEGTRIIVGSDTESVPIVGIYTIPAGGVYGTKITISVNPTLKKQRTNVFTIKSYTFTITGNELIVVFTEDYGTFTVTYYASKPFTTYAAWVTVYSPVKETASKKK